MIDLVFSDEPVARRLRDEHFDLAKEMAELIFSDRQPCLCKYATTVRAYKVANDVAGRPGVLAYAEDDELCAVVVQRQRMLARDIERRGFDPMLPSPIWLVEWSDENTYLIADGTRRFAILLALGRSAPAAWPWEWQPG